MTKERSVARSPYWPALLSALVAPGVGQIINKEYKKGILLLVASVGAFFWLIKVMTERLMMIMQGPPEQWTPAQLQQAANKMMSENPDMFLTFQVLMLLVWAFAIVDAYVTARRLRLDETARPTGTAHEDDPR